jgi:16S rRNA G966 N2-methylase RsmD
VLVLPASRAIRVLASRGEKVDGAFVDPPYQRGLTQETLSLLGISGIMADSGWVMTEHHCDERIAQRYHRLELTQTRRYGKTALALFRMGSREAMGSS